MPKKRKQFGTVLIILLLILTGILLVKTGIMHQNVILQMFGISCILLVVTGVIADKIEHEPVERQIHEPFFDPEKPFPPEHQPIQDEQKKEK